MMGVSNGNNGYSAKIETVTPAMAESWLASAAPNRRMSTSRISAYADAMRRGDWRVTDQGVGIGQDGTLYDGEHRLRAVVEAGVPIKSLVVFGLHPDDRTCIDKGRTRSVADELRIQRGTTSANEYIAYAKLCYSLLNKRSLVISTISDLDAHIIPFKTGIEWAVDTFAGGSRAFQRSGVAGALAFAYRTNPNKVSKFALQVRDGENLSAGEPAFVFRKFLLERHLNVGQTKTRIVTRKLLRCALAAVRDESIGKLEDSAKGVDYFRDAYVSQGVTTNNVTHIAS